MNTVTAPPLDHHYAFAQDVLHGLGQAQKSLPCKWFYDQTGSQLFEQITRTREYYPTRVETRLLGDIVHEIPEHVPELKIVIEPGSGASMKTRSLLESQPRLEAYIPIDISADFLHDIAQALQLDYPHLRIDPMVGDFADRLNPIKLAEDDERLVFFPGSTIGNFEPEQAELLLQNFHALSGEKGWLLLGVDTTRDEQLLTAAYNDQAGVTACFNKNLLVRANRELDANFEVELFEHQAHFNKDQGRVEMHLVSMEAHQVSVAGQTFTFAAGETIHTENCYKYDPQMLGGLAQNAGWQQVRTWQDQTESGFSLFLFKSENQP